MARIVMEEQQEFATLPAESIVHLKVEDVTVKEVPGRNGSWEKLEIKFKILGVQATGDGSPVSQYESLLGQNIWGSVPFRFTTHPENKLRMWTEEILGMELGVGFELETDNFLRREVRGVTSLYDKKAKDPKTGLPYQQHQIESLLRMGGSHQAAPQQSNPWGSQAPAQQQPTAPAADPWATQQPGQSSFAPSGGPTWEDPPF